MSPFSRQSLTIVGPACLLTLALAVPVATCAAATPPATTRAATRALSPVVLEAHRASFPSVALTSRGAAIAVWSHRPKTHKFHQVLRHTTLRVALGKAGHPWSAPVTLGHVGKVTEPSIGALSKGRAQVAFVNPSGGVMVRTWRAGHGWSRDTRISGRHDNAFTMSALATDPGSGRSALVYATGKSSPGDFSSTLHLAVHRGGGWQRYRLGPTSCLDFERPSTVAIDAHGAVAVAWDTQDAPSCTFTGHAKVAYLPATGHEITTHRYPMAPTFSVPLVRTPDGIQLFTPHQDLTTTIRSADGSGGWGDNETLAAYAIAVATDLQGDQVINQGQSAEVFSRTWGGAWAPAVPPTVNVKGFAVGAGGEVTTVGRHTTDELGIVESHGPAGGTTYSGAAVLSDSTRKFVNGNPPSLAVGDQGAVTMVAILARAEHLTDGAVYAFRYSIPPAS